MSINYRDRGFKDYCLTVTTTGNAATGIAAVAGTSINLIGTSAHALSNVLYLTDTSGRFSSLPILSVAPGGFNFPGTVKLPAGSGVYISPGTSPDHLTLFYFLSN